MSVHILLLDRFNMLQLIVITAVIACAYGAPIELSELAMVPMIVGGQATTIEQFPWQVSSQFLGSHNCGGSIVTANRIITAAHCTLGTPTANHAIRAGSTQSNTGGQLIQVINIINHPEYSPITRNNDISTMWLATSLNMAPAGVSAIRLPETTEAAVVGQLSQVTGWGALWEGGPMTTTLQVVAVPVVTNDACNAALGGGITPQMLCAGFAAGGQDACLGDSGGALVQGNTLIGIVSWGVGCARPNLPGVYVRTQMLRTWIDQSI